MALEIGKANYKGGGSKLVYYRLGMQDNQRSLTVRIAPPVKDLAKNGYIATYVKQHFGYTVAGKGDKRIPKTFVCVERRDKNKNIVQNCPECDEIAMRKADIEAKTNKFKASGTPDDVAEAQLRPAKAWLKEHNLDKKWNLLAKNEKGEWGILSIGHKCYEDLVREIGEVQTKMEIEDPTGVEGGVWFEFSRTGTAFNNIVDKVSVVKMALGKGQFGVKQDTLTDADLKAIEDLPALTSLGFRISYDQIARLVESGGDETVIKSVFESAQPRSEASPTTTVRTSAPTTVVKTEPASTIAPAPAAVAPPTPTDIEAQMAAVQAQLAALRAMAAGATAPAPVAAQPTVSPALTRKLEVDPDAFLAEFGTPDEE
jgi:hypothetical protein